MTDDTNATIDQPDTASSPETPVETVEAPAPDTDSPAVDVPLTTETVDTPVALTELPQPGAEGYHPDAGLNGLQNY